MSHSNGGGLFVLYDLFVNGTMFGWSTVRRDLEEYFGTRINNPDTLN